MPMLFNPGALDFFQPTAFELCTSALASIMLEAIPGHCQESEAGRQNGLSSQCLMECLRLKALAKMHTGNSYLH